VVGILGYPLDYTLSPAIHNAAFAGLGMNWLYIPMRVPPALLRPAVRGLLALGFKGANVTIPHKMSAAAYVGEMRGDAEIVQAVNTIAREGESLIGFNTDAQGFEAFLDEAGIEVQGASVTMIGAGGAARAVALALLRKGAARIFLMNRTEERVFELQALLKRAFSDSEILGRTFDYEGAKVIKDCSLIINCTPLGSTPGDLPPVLFDDFHEGQWVVDLKYRGAGAFLKEASARGARTANGEGLLLHQAAASFTIWTGRGAPIAIMREAIEQARVL
jgi:shikimate dehydrogenase